MFKLHARQPFFFVRIFAWIYKHFAHIYTERKKKRIFWHSKRRIYYKKKILSWYQQFIPINTDN